MTETAASCSAASSPATDRETAERLLSEARDASEPSIRYRLFREAVITASRTGDQLLEDRILALMVIFQIGGGHVRELVSKYWPLFRDLGSHVRRISEDHEQHLLLRAGEKILYYAVEFPEVPARALEQALAQWLDALAVAGGYCAAAGLRLQLHVALRMNRLAEATALFAAPERAEPEADLSPRAGKLPGEDDQFSFARATDFGCAAYSSQIRVRYPCALGDARAAWRAARYFVDGRSACDLSLCGLAPREALAEILEPLDSAGMTAEADRCHAIGLPMVSGNSNTVGWLGHHLRHLARRGDSERALVLLNEAMPDAATPFQRLHFLRGAVAVQQGSDRKNSETAELLCEAEALGDRFNIRNDLIQVATG